MQVLEFKGPRTQRTWSSGVQEYENIRVLTLRQTGRGGGMEENFWLEALPLTAEPSL